MRSPSPYYRPTTTADAPAGRDLRSESGAALVLVLVLILVGSLLVWGLAKLAANDLHNSGNFAKARSLSYDATNAIDVAAQSIRYTPLLAPTQTLNASPPGSCWLNGEPATLPNTGGNHFRVWCSTRWDPTSSSTRTVTLSACLASHVPPTTPAAAASCAAKPVVQEVVTFDDYPAGIATPTQAPCVTYCGQTMTVDSWVEHPVIPKVTNVSCAPSLVSCTIVPIGGPITGGSAITVTGTGFVQGATVQFVEEAGGTPTGDNVVLTSPAVSVASSTSLTATVPAVTEGTTYFVTVTTPAGTSAYGTADVFTYAAQIPTVTSVCTGSAGTGPGGATCNTSAHGTKAKGPVSGGNELTIWGTDFLCRSSCAVPGGQPAVSFVSGSYSISAQYVTIVSDTEVTVTTPPEFKVKPTTGAHPARFYVTVDTSPESVTFTYVGIVPTVETVTYNSPGTVTITGTGFVTTDGYSVGFVRDSTGPVALGVGGPSTSTASGAMKVFYPSGLSATDLLVLAIAHSYSNTVSCPSGWTREATINTTAGGRGYLETCYRFWTTGTHVTVTVPSTHATTGWTAEIAAFRGVTKSKPFDGQGATSASAAGATTFTPAGLTTSKQNDLALSFAMENDDTSTTPALTLVPGATKTFTALHSAGVGTVHSNALDLAERIIATAGAVSFPTWSSSVTHANSVWTAISLALNAIPGTSPSVASPAIVVKTAKTIVAGVPSSLPAGKYFVTVTSPQGTSSLYPTFTLP